MVYFFKEKMSARWSLLFLVTFWMSLVLVYWWVTYVSIEGRYLSPGDAYVVDNITYTLPNLPLSPDPVMILSESMLSRQLKLLDASIAALQDKYDPFLMYGTLLGWVRHKTIIPWDDDIDLAVHVKHRHYMYSSGFVKDMAEAGLEVLYMRYSSASRANRLGSVVRLRFPQWQTPVVDIFFVGPTVQTLEEETDETWYSQIAGWSTEDGFDTNTTDDAWAIQIRKGDIYPVQPRSSDGTPPLPKRPENICTQLWSENAIVEMRGAAFGLHQFPFRVLTCLWTTKAPGGTLVY